MVPQVTKYSPFLVLCCSTVGLIMALINRQFGWNFSLKSRVGRMSTDQDDDLIWILTSVRYLAVDNTLRCVSSCLQKKLYIPDRVCSLPFAHPHTHTHTCSYIVLVMMLMMRFLFSQNVAAWTADDELLCPCWALRLCRHLNGWSRECVGDGTADSMRWAQQCCVCQDVTHIDVRLQAGRVNLGSTTSSVWPFSSSCLDLFPSTIQDHPPPLIYYYYLLFIHE